MKIKLIPNNERPREKLLQQGAAILTDSELLAIFIRTGVKGKSALDIARELLMKFGNLRNLLNSPQKEICAFPGLGKTKFVEIHAGLELTKRYLAASLEKQNIIDNNALACLFLIAKMRNLPHEVFACIFLDNSNQVISYEELFQGTINNAVIYPRKILQRALELNAAAIIFAHNHTSGPATPSNADRELTLELHKLLAAIDVKLLDHIIIGSNDYFSFTQNGG